MGDEASDPLDAALADTAAAETVVADEAWTSQVVETLRAGDTGNGGKTVSEAPPPKSGPSPYAPTKLAAGSGAPGTDEVVLTDEHPGRYVVREELGRGGHGQVLAAYDRHLERKVALKQLHAEAAAGFELSPLELRFVNEARITGKLEHPGIVPVYELGRRADGSVYYVMRLVRGESLQDALEGAEDLEARLRLLPSFIDACNAVAYAHSRGVVHRDLKPENIMLGPFGQTLVVDWGLAKVKGEDDIHSEVLADEMERIRDSTRVRTVHGSVVGTPSYMPPEQCLGLLEEIDERSDVYALGAVLYHLITGRPPFIGPTMLDIIKATIEDELLPPIERELDCPRELDAIAVHALARDPEDRYADAQSLAADVRAFLDGGIVGAHRYSTSQRLRRWIRKRRYPVLAACALIVATGGTALYLEHKADLAMAAREAQIEADRLATERAHRDATLAEVDALLTDAERGATAPRWLETYAFRIVTLADPVVAEALEKRLTEAVVHPSRPVRKLAARSLGGLRRDGAIHMLTSRLAEDGEKDIEVQVEIINALGVIGDPRAEHAVRKARWRAGQYSTLWEQTVLAYRMIPMPEIAEGETLSPDEWTDRGRSISNKGNREGAIAAYDQAIELDPTLGRAYNNRAIELARLERYEEALRDYNKSIELDPGEPKGIYNRAVLKRKMEDYEGAIADYTLLIDGGKLVGMSLRSRARAFRWLNQPDEALADYERARELDPTNPRTHYGLGFTYLDMGNYQDAVAAFDRTLAINDKMTTALVGRAWAHRMQGNLEIARRDLDRAVELDPAKDSVRVNRASVLMVLGERERAMADLSHCVDNDCTSDTLAYPLAARAILGQLAQSNTAKALTDLDAAFEAASKHTDRIETALWGLAIATSLNDDVERKKWEARLTARGNRWHDRLARIVKDGAPHEAMLAEVAPDRHCLVLVGVALRAHRDDRPDDARKHYGEAADTPRPADLSCALASALHDAAGVTPP